MLKILIAEDNIILGEIAYDMLVDHGYEVCGIARTVAEAIALAQRCKPDLALLDQQLANGGLGTEIAARLNIDCRVGVLYATGDPAQVMLLATSGDACLSKPYNCADLLRGLEVVTDIVASGAALPPFPDTLRVLAPSTTAD
jgi:DNA-binding response OmpR family regulator